MNERGSSSSGLPPPPPPFQTAAIPDDPRKARIKLIKNDYNQNFVDTSQRPQNFIRDSEPDVRFVEYPKLDKLLRLKNELSRLRSHPPQHIKADLKTIDFSLLGGHFDVILVDPPWAEYQQRSTGMSSHEDLSPWTVDEIAALPVEQIADNPSFCFIWAGSSHLDDARYVLSKWGFRRCEDICWLKLNSKPKATLVHDSILQRVKEHCLMGIRGGARRSVDTHLLHSNIDTDVVLDEEPDDPCSTAKPAELYDIIERFALGRKRIELFGCDRNIRRGWLTVGKSISVSNFDSARYNSWFANINPPLTVGPHADSEAQSQALICANSFPEILGYRGGRFLGTTAEIEQLRPKSPKMGPSAASSDRMSEISI